MKESRDPKERRRHARIRVTYMALLTTNENDMQRRTIAVGQVLDISPSGVRVEVDTVVQIGAHVLIRMVIQDSALEVAGKVVYSSLEADRQQVLGIELDEPIKDLCIET